MNIFVLGAKPEIKVEPGDGYLEKLRKTGSNTGNQVIAYSLLRQIEYQKISWDHRLDPADVNEEYDAFVIPAANFLFPAFDFGGMAEYIERTDLPVVIVGLGAQANAYDADIKLMPGTERFLKVVSERAALIGVRGTFTAEVLARRGIRNVEITGCPSYYMKNSPHLGLSKPDFASVKTVAANGSRDVIKHAFNPDKMGKLVRDIYREAILWNGDFVAQTEQPEIQLSEQAPGMERGALDNVRAFLKDVMEPERVETWAKEHIHAYFSVPDWLNSLDGVDFVFGTRFHGNVVALQRGIPACVVCHDTRTEEICRHLGIPSVSIMEIEEVRVADLYERVDCDRLNARYAELYPAYVNFLARNKLKSMLALG